MPYQEYDACPKCGGEVYQNREKKAKGDAKPGTPDVKCKDTNGCGWAHWDKPKGSKDSTPAPAVKSNTTAAPVQSSGKSSYNDKGNYGNGVPQSMYGAWAMNLIISLVEMGVYKTLEQALADYPVALKKVGEAIDSNKAELDKRNPVPASQVERQVGAPASTAKPENTPLKTNETEALPDPLQKVADELSGAADEISLDNLDFNFS